MSSLYLTTLVPVQFKLEEGMQPVYKPPLKDLHIPIHANATSIPTFFFFFTHFSCCTKVMHLVAVVRSFQEPCNKTSHWKYCTLKDVNDVRPELRYAQPLLLWFRGLCCLLWRCPGSLPVITGKSWIVICWRPLVPVNWLYLIAHCGDKSEHRRSSRGATVWKKRTDPRYLLV